ncbi:MAG: 7-carboxy-7-deazaguanine synthase QueE [Steroidobacteraceae bacterium]
MSDSATDSRLKVTEIFLSLQGEAATVGFPTVFVRLTGCPLRCAYCDTAYAFTGGEWWSQAAVLGKVASFSTRHVCVTGGEPLAQRACLPLLGALCDAGHVVSLETSGALPIDAVDPRVQRVVDVKTPGSGEAARNRYGDFALLTAHDLLKFVITGRADYEWALAQVRAHRLDGRCTVFFSPSHGALPARELAEWILADRAPVRFQIQLHKLLWGDEPGR